MKKNHILLGALFTVGAIAGYMLVAKNKMKKGCGCDECSEKSKDMVNADGVKMGRCAVCKNSETQLTYSSDRNRNCKPGDTCITRYSYEFGSN